MMNYLKNMIFGIKSSIVFKKIDSEPIYNRNFLKTKIKSYSAEATDFHDEDMPKVGFNCIYLAVRLIEVVLKNDEKKFVNKDYYPQVF